TTKIAEANQPNPSITSIYFDNPGFSLYTQKVDHGEATSLRLRWYGQLNARPEIYVEKKTVRDDDTASEDRLAMKEKYVQQFISTEYKMDKQIQKLSDRAGASSPEVKNFKTAVDDIQELIKSNNLQPVLRANYTRTAFQIPGDDRVRVSLDTDLAFIREDAIDTDRPIRDPDSWHRTDIDSNGQEYPFSSIRKGEISKFPFALLEIKIRSADRKRSAWVKDLMSSHLVKEAPRFSKFVHGVALLFEDYVNTFPFWLSEMETDIRQDPQAAFEEEQAKAQKERDDEFAVGSLLTTKPSKSSLRSGSKAVLSPVGSPNVSSSFQPKSLDARKSNLAPVAESQPADTAGEPDDDETGTRGAATSKLTNLFPSFSTSKYARSRRTALPPGVSKPETWIKDSGPVKVEAKVWLANQRTFIKWQHVSVLLGTLGLGLYNAAGVDNNVARGLAVVYTLVAVFAGMWGYFVYMWRVSLIKGRSGKDFDAVAGPVIVCLGLGVALVLNFVFKYRAAIEERQDNQVALNAVSWNQTAAMPHFGDL
ncbi:Phosphate metabolism transcription protein, partial [Oleoguttula sp. CCFEE 5521]